MGAGGDWTVFEQRPLPKSLIDYCVQDVSLIPRLWNAYDSRLTFPWRRKVETETLRRLQLAKLPTFSSGREKALSPWWWVSLLHYSDKPMQMRFVSIRDWFNCLSCGKSKTLKYASLQQETKPRNWVTRRFQLFRCSCCSPCLVALGRLGGPPSVWARHMNHLKDRCLPILSNHWVRWPWNCHLTVFSSTTPLFSPKQLPSFIVYLKLLPLPFMLIWRALTYAAMGVYRSFRSTLPQHPRPTWSTCLQWAHWRSQPLQQMVWPLNHCWRMPVSWRLFMIAGMTMTHCGIYIKSTPLVRLSYWICRLVI